jgi:hypothetical protein
MHGQDDQEERAERGRMEGTRRDLRAGEQEQINTAKQADDIKTNEMGGEKQVRENKMTELS